jgi:exonuclease VII large subunit
MALQGPTPRLAIITGVASVAVDDILAQLREAEADLTLDVVRVSMHRPGEVVKAIRQVADVQAIALTRGGGQVIHELDTEDLIADVASSLIPVLVALGHASDELVVGRVADASFPTPTALGAWFREVVEDKRRQARQTDEARLLTESKELLIQLGRLHVLQASVGRWRLLAVIVVIVWAATLVWLLVGQ